MAVARITKEDLKLALDASDVAGRPLPVDVRLKYPYEHSTLKIPGAIRLLPTEPLTHNLPKHRDLVLYCSDPDEITSSRIAADLIRQGYRASVLKGGIGEWIGASLPTESKDPSRLALADTGAPKA